MSKQNKTDKYIITLSFFILIIIGAILLKLPISTQKGIKWIDAFFTSTSAVCVTGLTVVDTSTNFTLFGQIVILILIQLGGLGLMTFAAFFFVATKNKLSLIDQNIIEETLLPEYSQIKLKKILLFLIKYTFFIEFIGFLSYLIFLKESDILKRIFFSIFHSISAFCNAGFSNYSNSLMDYNNNIPINLITIFLIIFGGIGFIVAFEIKSKIKNIFLKKKNKLKNYYLFSLHTWIVLKTSFILIIVGTLSIFIIENLSNGKISFLESLFQSVTSRTAGFNTVDLAKLNKGTLIIIICLMFIGGSPGSTAGGIKTVTFTIIFSLLFFSRNNFEDVIIRNRLISKKNVYLALMIFIFSFFIVFFAFLLISIFDSKKDSLAVIFESISAFGTVGLSLGITSELNNISKFLLIITMFCGRLGSLTIFSLIFLKEKYPGEYAKENVFIV